MTGEDITVSATIVAAWDKTVLSETADLVEVANGQSGRRGFKAENEPRGPGPW